MWYLQSEHNSEDNSVTATDLNIFSIHKLTLKTCKTSTYLFPSEQGLMMYWHIGRRRNAKATVAITVNRREQYSLLKTIVYALKTVMLDDSKLLGEWV